MAKGEMNVERYVLAHSEKALDDFRMLTRTIIAEAYLKGRALLLSNAIYLYFRVSLVFFSYLLLIPRSLISYSMAQIATKKAAIAIWT